MSDFKKKKHYGQNFLTSPAIPARIARESGIDGECGVIEIGPGFGILTAELAKIAKKVVSVEIDTELIPILAEKTAHLPNVKIINADILQTDIPKLADDEFRDMPVCVCANLPYYITTPIIMHLFECGVKFRSVTVMVQREVADRLCAASGTPGYGAITVSVNYYARVKKLFGVSAGSFSPPPKVDSAVVRFDLYETPPVKVSDKGLFDRVIRASFMQRRKTLVNSLHSFFNSSFTKAELCDIIASIGLKYTVRGEELNLQSFAALSECLYEKLHKFGGKT